MLGGILWIHPLPIAMAQAPAFHNLDPLKLILTLSSHPTLLCLITCLVLSHTPPCNKICHHIESIPLHQWCQLELGSCHHTAVQPLDSMEIACLYALCGVLGVKANKIHGWDAQNAQGEQVAHLWTYTFLFKEEAYIEAFKHFLLGTD